MAKSLHVMLRRVIKRVENVLYRMAGLPITIAVPFTASQGAAATIRRTYAVHYWSPDDWADALEIGVAIGIWPIALVCGALFFAWRNGGIIARRSVRRHGDNSFSSSSWRWPAVSSRPGTTSSRCTSRSAGHWLGASSIGARQKGASVRCSNAIAETDPPSPSYSPGGG